MIERLLTRIVRFSKQLKSDFAEGYADGKARSSLGWSFNWRHWRKKR